MNNDFTTRVMGHVKIADADTGEVLLDKQNAIHSQNMARVLARGLAHEASSWVYAIQLGNGGTHIDGGGNISFMQPNVIGVGATLYNATYATTVDASVISNTTNSVTSNASPAPSLTSTVTVSVLLDSALPIGQAANDGITTNPDSTYTFDELALFTTINAENPAITPSNLTGGSMLSMLVFSPIEKTANRNLILTYTLTLSVV